MISLEIEKQNKKNVNMTPPEKWPKLPFFRVRMLDLAPQFFQVPKTSCLENINSYHSEPKLKIPFRNYVLEKPKNWYDLQIFLFIKLSNFSWK